jgi:mRNA interferase RelE/StbE
MKYTIIYNTLINRKEFAQLPKADLRRIHEAITEKLAMDPISFGKPLRYSMKGHRSLRVADYRIIYRVDKDIVKIFVIGHRSTVYKELD